MEQRRRKQPEETVSVNSEGERDLGSVVIMFFNAERMNVDRSRTCSIVRGAPFSAFYCLRQTSPSPVFS